MAHVNFFSQKGAPFQHLDAVTTNVPAAPFVGRWATLELKPDLFVPQHFSVGVIVQADTQRLHYQLLDDVKKFSALYSTRGINYQVTDLLRHAEKVLRHGIQNGIALTDIDFSSQNLWVSAPAHTSGELGTVILDRLYRDVVIMAP